MTSNEWMEQMTKKQKDVFLAWKVVFISVAFINCP